jgi:hypothetical protein
VTFSLDIRLKITAKFDLCNLVFVLKIDFGGKGRIIEVELGI